MLRGRSIMPCRFWNALKKVIVLTAEGAGETYDLAAEAALMEYLHAHGIHAQASSSPQAFLPPPKRCRPAPRN